VTWLGNIRRRALWIVVFLLATALGVIAWTTIPAWPVVGVAVASVALVLNSLTSRLAPDVCLSCGVDIAQQPRGAHGRICHACGAVNELPGLGDQPGAETLPRDDDDRVA
jgi:hypothetical protein